MVGRDAGPGAAEGHAAEGHAAEPGAAAERHAAEGHAAEPGAAEGHAAEGHAAEPGAARLPIRVRVRLFAMHRELTGLRQLDLELPAGSNPEDAWASLAARFPSLAPGRPSVRFAVNGAYAAPDATLADGDELALIPPVSGGADEPATGPAGAGAPRRILELRADPFPPDLLARLEARLATPADGAVVGFVGRTRVTPGSPAPGEEAAAERHAGEPVESLDYEAHEPMVLAVLAAIADEVAARFGVVRLAIVHRTGNVQLGAPSVAVVAVAPHRDVAFAAARYAIDETKARAPIWKAERFAGGHVWTGEAARTAAREQGGAQGGEPAAEEVREQGGGT